MATKQNGSKKQIKKTKQLPKHNVQRARLDKMFENKDFSIIANNTMAFNEPDEELVNIWYDVFQAIIRSNPDTRSYQPSIWLLFASIAEVYYLHKDRKTRQRQKQEMYQSWIDSNEFKINEQEDIIANRLEKIDLIKLEIKTWKERHPKKEMKRELQLRKTILDIKADMQDRAMIISDLKQQNKAHKRSMELKMFEVTVNEKITFDMTAQVINKNQALLEIMKQFNINPKLVDSNRFENGGQTGLGGMFGGLK